MPDTPSKSILKSKTFWVNMIVLAAGVAGFVAGQDVIADYPAVVAIFGAVQGGLNIVLRLVTSQPIS
jgi:hypothetical protein